jgi:hypothetical protein
MPIISPYMPYIDLVALGLILSLSLRFALLLALKWGVIDHLQKRGVSICWLCVSFWASVLATAMLYVLRPDPWLLLLPVPVTTVVVDYLIYPPNEN